MGQRKSKARARKADTLGGRIIGALERVAVALEKSGGHYDEYTAGLLDIEGIGQEEAAAQLLERIADALEKSAGVAEEVDAGDADDGEEGNAGA